MPTEFKLPELGENVAAGDVLRVMVSPGDSISKDDPVLELETDKATLEVPSSVAGVVKEISVKAGDKVEVGQLILTVDAGDDQSVEAATAAPQSAPSSAEHRPEQAASHGGPAQHVGDRPRAVAEDKPVTIREDQRPAAALDESADEDGAKPSRAASPRGRGEVVDISRSRAASVPTEAAPPSLSEAEPAAPAAPSVRRLARELGVDINEVPGTGPASRISIDDVKAHARSLIMSGAVARPAGGPAAPAGPLPDFTRWGEVDRQPMRSIRRKTAQHLSQAWATIPHVTQHDRADVTELEEVRRRFEKKAEAAGGALTITAIALKVIATALKSFPQFNASVDMVNEEIICKKYVHIGVAVDTDRGLLVPVIRDADRKNILQISSELARAAEKARAGKLTREEMEGGSFTITNLGGIGGTAFSPIVNAPEVAILGISRASTQPLFVNGAFEPRLMLPLSLSYDHRVIDGADAIRFVRWVVEALEQPFLLSLQG